MNIESDLAPSDPILLFDKSISVKLDGSLFAIRDILFESI